MLLHQSMSISFFTFQAMSYVFDLYLGKVQVQKNLLNLALYVALFPQLTRNIISQNTQKHYKNKLWFTIRIKQNRHK